MGKQWKQWQTLFLGGSKITEDGDCSWEIKKTLAPWKKSYDQPRQHIKKQRPFANKGPSSQSYGFSSSHVWMWELDLKESWVPTNWRFWTVVLEKILESLLDFEVIQPIHLKGKKKERKRRWYRSVMSDSLQPHDCSPSVSSVHGILQGRILERVAISFSSRSS